MEPKNIHFEEAWVARDQNGRLFLYRGRKPDRTLNARTGQNFFIGDEFIYLDDAPAFAHIKPDSEPVRVTFTVSLL